MKSAPTTEQTLPKITCALQSFKEGTLVPLIEMMSIMSYYLLFYFFYG